ncbi:Zinc finger RING-type [Penicillium riverlandense]|uniref:Zinc finger RING-type n=1 Tax=Penicillium riverlandense TaxID=1903569 RepID=UPI002547730A|nr:Zinc finger RING-type [Penicillium riverlandense]KAJ5804896.1 Zinc finger RING-type [Penicillium riverlandense]
MFASLPSSFFLLFLLLLLPSFLSSARADLTVEPSNSPHDISSVRYHLHSHISLLNNQTLAPLTDALTSLSDAQLQAFNLTGPAVAVTPSNSFTLPKSSIACISCDQSEYELSGFVNASSTVSNVISSGKALAILLYSESAGHCDYSSDENFANVFTLLSPDAAKALLDSIGSSLSILSAMSTTYIPAGSTDPLGAQQNNDSPNTAMIILYSITGIITALFLGIIVTGAVRAHRHPERYGPRRIAGRARQSRARGIARAMLETIPIVKFGDNEDSVEAVKRDVEMTMNPDESPREHSPPRSDSITAVEMTAPGDPRPSTPEQPSDRPQTTAHESKTDVAPDAGNFSCPICTDDFIKGQDLRVLPCNHQFHMECIDPWLVNVSGTCPLCRINLNPPQAEENAEQGEGETGENTNTEATPDGTATPTADATHHHSHRRLTTLLHSHSPLNARRMHEATVEERLAALRRVREETQGQSQVEGSRPSRSRLTTRLRDRFRIRTRAHGIEGSSGVQTPAEPAVPAPTPAAPTPPAPAAESET